MSDSIVNNTFINNQLTTEVGDKVIAFQGRDIYFANHLIRDAKRSDYKDKTLLDLRSPKKKIFISTNVGVYNFFYTIVGSIIRANKSQPDAEFIIDPTQINIGYDNRNFLPMLSRIMEELKASYTVINFHYYEGILTNNFSVIDPGGITFSKEDVLDLNRISLKLSEASESKPIKKVYVSRKNVINNRDFTGFFKPGLPFTRDFRLENEPLLENFLSELGFEIVYGEDFESMEDQIRFFSEVDVLVSITSSGIANSLFMKPGGTILEFATTFGIAQPFGATYVPSDDVRLRKPPTPPFDAAESLHHLYRDLCYKMDHTYISIPNYTRQAKDICDRITNLKHLKELFNLGE